MKLNKKILGAAILFGLFSLKSTIAIQVRPKSFDSWFMFIGSLILFIIALIKLWKFRQLEPQISPDKHNLITTEFKNSTIIFPNGYYFKCSNVKKGEELNAQRITEINLNTAPPSFVLDNKEVIFIKHEFKQELESFAKSNNIPIVERPEIWEMLCEPYLDTSFDENHERETIKSLIENGLTEQEIIAIRKRIKNRMLFMNSFVWEWVHLGQFDYLNWTTFLFKSKYWWTMEIALRNLRIKK